MSSAPAVANPLERIAEDPLWLRQFSVAEYHKMIETGILHSGDRVELLEGWIVKKMSQNPPHSASVNRVNRILSKVLPAGWSLRIQSPVTLSDSEPEPDLTVARGDAGTYDDHHPERAEIDLLIEIGDSSVLIDRRYKGALYAQERIPEFWLMNLVRRILEVYTKPRNGKYQKKVEYTETQKVSLTLNGEKIAEILVSELMPKA